MCGYVRLDHIRDATMCSETLCDSKLVIARYILFESRTDQYQTYIMRSFNEIDLRSQRFFYFQKSKHNSFEKLCIRFFLLVFIYWESINSHSFMYVLNTLMWIVRVPICKMSASAKKKCTRQMNLISHHNNKSDDDDATVEKSHDSKMIDIATIWCRKFTQSAHLLVNSILNVCLSVFTINNY